MPSDRASDQRPASPRLAEWVVSRERGTTTMLRLMTLISLRLGRPVGRIVLHGIAAYFFAFAPGARRAARQYLSRALGRKPMAIDRYRLIFSFASTIHDRVYLINGRYDLFNISLEGEPLVRARLERGNGAFLMGAHLGSFEVTRAVGRIQPGLAVAMAMYEDNARKISSMLTAVNPRLRPDIISLGTIDSMLQIRARLDAGTFIGVLGDRTPGAEPFVRVQFLGAPACFPTGAMRAAAILRRPVLFMVGLYRGGNRYHVVFDKLADFSTISANDRDSAVQAAIRRYASLLERYCKSDPYNWFNFFDFWQEPSASADRRRSAAR